MVPAGVAVGSITDVGLVEEQAANKILKIIRKTVRFIIHLLIFSHIIYSKLVWFIKSSYSPIIKLTNLLINPNSS